MSKRPPPPLPDRDKHWVEIHRTYPIGWEVVHTLHGGMLEIYPHPWVPTKRWARWKARRMIASEERKQAGKRAPRERIDP